MNAIECCRAVETGAAETVSSMLDRISIQAQGRGMAMNVDSQDKVNAVIDKLETMINLFEFYWYAREKTGFNKDSIAGLCLIINDCVVQLREAVK
jgi:hypothetical protein